MENAIIRTATLSNAPTLTQLGIDTFVETFGHLYTPEDLNTYLTTTYTPEIQRNEIKDPNKTTLVVESEGHLIGFALMGPCKLPVENPPQPAIELYRFYISAPHQGTGLGKKLLNHCLSQEIIKSAASIWLGVWSENTKAQTFYEHVGFTKVGEYDFPVGNQLDREFIYCLTT